MPVITYSQLDGFLKTLKPGNTQSASCQAFLFHGNEYLYRTALAAVRNTLMPETADKMNYETVDGDTGYLREAIERICTVSLLAGPKIVAVIDSKIFYSKHDHERILQKMKNAFDRHDLKSASRLFVRLLSLLKITYADLDHDSLKKSVQVNQEDLVWLKKVADYCRSKQVEIPPAIDLSEELNRIINKGFPRGNYFVMTSDLVDKRRRLYKSFESQGLVIDCSVPKGDRKADRDIQQKVMEHAVADILNQYGKTIAADARSKLYDITGFDLRSIANNIKKLIDYIEPRTDITIEDVSLILKRSKQDPIYALTNAFADRDINQTLFYINSLLKNNYHPLQILSALLNQTRKLLTARDFIESRFGNVWRQGIGYTQFRRQVIPALQSYDRVLTDFLGEWHQVIIPPAHDTAITKKQIKSGKARTDLMLLKNPANAYPVYLLLSKAQKFSHAKLVTALHQWGEVDRQLKSSTANPRLIIEKTILSILMEVSQTVDTHRNKAVKSERAATPLKLSGASYDKTI